MYFLKIFVISALVLIESNHQIWAKSIDAVALKFESRRERVLLAEQEMAFGGNVTLDEMEESANNCLMKAKFEEVDDAFYDPSKFLPAKNFLKVREQIENSKVFKIIQKMPKGGLFHAHSAALGTFEFFRDNVLNLPNLYICEDNNMIRFLFSLAPKYAECNWRPLKKLRATRPDIDSKIEKSLQLQDCDPKVEDCDNINVIWKKFKSIFASISGLIKNREVFQKYLEYGLKLLYDDNVSFLELRTGLSWLYDVDGRKYNFTEVAGIFKQVVDTFRRRYPDFIGMKIIYSVHRKTSTKTVSDSFKKFKILKEMYPTFIKGFDLVDQEDLGEPLIKFKNELMQAGEGTQFFFHSGETNWYGHSSDENLVDAILLHTKRIGHGFALVKHPKLLQMVEKEKIAIEINPISNQVLGLVKDMRNHPASHFFARNLPIVVASDDPGFWGARGLSYDFYEAFIGMMSRNADLGALKQLAMNSIIYSTLSDDEKKKAWNNWRSNWKKFVDDLAKEGACPRVQRRKRYRGPA